MIPQDDPRRAQMGPKAEPPGVSTEDSLMTRCVEGGGLPAADYSATLSQSAGGTHPYLEPVGEGPAGERTRFGEYEIVRRIAKGGMGFVYEARHVKLGLPVALKMIGAGDAATEADVQRFLVEAQAVAKLHKHPNIVKIYSISEEGGQHFFAMQLIRGGSLKDRLAECAADPRMAAELMVRVADAIAHAHRRGVLHRDLKPDNILIDEEGAPYVTDFGLAKRVDPTEGASMTIGPDSATQALWAKAGRPEPTSPEPPWGFESSSKDVEGSILGTPSFMPPEQAQGRLKDVSTLSDVYSLGATLFAMLCNRPPFLGPGVQNVLNQVIGERPPSLRPLNPKVDRDLEAICLKCLEKQPKDRYESAEALGRELQRWLDGRPIHARPVAALEKIRKWSRREPIQAGAAGLGSALVILAVAMGIWIAVDRSRIRDARLAQQLEKQKTELAEQQRSFAEEKAKLAQASSTLTLRTAGEAVAQLLDAFESELGAESQQQALRMRLLGHALRYFEGVVRDHQGRHDEDAANRLELAKAHQQVAKLAGKIGSDRRDDVIKNYKAAIAILEDLAGDVAGGRGEKASDAILAELGNAYQEYGIVQGGRGEAGLALDLYHKGRAAYERACRPCEAHEHRGDCGCVGETEVRSGLGRSWGYIGDLHEAAGRVAEAEAAYRSSHKIREKLFEDFKDTSNFEPELTLQLGRSFGNLAVLARHRGDLTLAILQEQKAVELQELLLKKVPDDSWKRQAREDLVYYLRQAAKLRVENGEPEKAIVEVNKAIGHADALMEEKPGVVTYRVESAAAQLVLAEALFDRGDPAKAAESCQKAEELLEGAKDFRDALENQLASVHRDMLVGKFALRQGRPAEAREPLTRSRILLDSLIERDPLNNEYRSDHAENLALLAEAHRAADPSLASDFYKMALAEQSLVNEERNGGRIKRFQSRLNRFKAMRPSFE